MELVKGWETWWRKWSTWLISTGASLVLAAPEITRVWQELPPEIQATLPSSWVQTIGGFIVLCAIPASMIRQQRLYDAVHVQAPARRGRPRKAVDTVEQQPVAAPRKRTTTTRRKKVDPDKS